MGGALQGAQGYRSLFDITSLQGQSVAFFVWYFLCIVLVIWGIAALASQDPDAITPTAAGWFMPLFTSFVHIAVLLISYAAIPSFVAFPVAPRALFASLDILTAVCFGLSIGGLSANSIALLMIANGLLVLSFAFACYKYFTIVYEIRAGKRSEATGARVR